jgi:tetratricopeptide (TPR) repeat protein
MINQLKSPPNKIPKAVFVLLFLLVLAAYSNTFQTAWHLDDYPNIVENSRLRITDLSFDSLFKTLFSHPGSGNGFRRPLAWPTFALNWYFGKDDVTGFHTVNLIIHLLTAALLFLTILNLFKSPNLRGRYPGGEQAIALLAATLWVINPIQTQAVTYIVQRMALMAAMFYILGIYFYIKARIDQFAVRRILYYLGCFFSFVFACGSKENAIMLPAALVLLEMVFFQNLSLQKTRRVFLGAAVGIGLLVFIAGALFFGDEDLLFFLKGYAYRPFSLAERLMTEPRILIHYLSQIFYPVPNRLSIHHDVVVSTSLWQPWTTLPSLLLVIFFIYFGFSQIQKRPIVAFSIIFFFMNHLVESTIIPLELVFEHRNYLPSLFLFWPVSVGLCWLLDYYRQKKLRMYGIILSFSLLLIIGLAGSTYIRNMAWATEPSLWQDAMKKAPGSSRPCFRLAAYYSKAGRLDESIALLKKGFSLSHQRPRSAQVLYYNNMGNTYRKKQDYDNATHYLEMALELEPHNKAVRENLALALFESQRWHEAVEHFDILLKTRYNNVIYLRLKAFILIKQNKPEQAIPYLKRALRLAPNSRDSLIYAGVALSLSGKYEKSDELLRGAHSLYPKDVSILVCLADNSLRAEKNKAAGAYLDALLDVIDGKQLLNLLKAQSQDNRTLPLSYELLISSIGNKIETKAAEASAD